MEAELNNYWLQIHDPKDLAAFNAVRHFRKKAEQAPFMREAFWYFYYMKKLLDHAAHGYPPEHLAQDMQRYRH
jgi:hypothetical protein